MTTLAAAPRDVLSHSNRIADAALEMRTSQRVTRHETATDERRTARDQTPLAVRVPGVARDIEVKIASEPEEWEQACRLVASNYQSRGYETLDAGRLRFTPYHALPDTVIFVAKDREQVIGTVTLVPDNTLLGLPMESIYGKEIAELRRAGVRLGESISLAIAGIPLRESLQVMHGLLRLKMQYHISQGGDTWVMTVNPRHRNYYTKIMGYVPLGTCRAYEAVQGAPAEAFWLDLESMAANAPRTHQEFFGEPLPREALKSSRIPAHLIRSFSGKSSRTDIQTVAGILDFVDHYGSPRRW